MIAAAITAVYLTLGSHHVDEQWKHREGFNERNPGVIVEIDRRLITGVYNNSFERTTTLVGRRWELARFGAVEVSTFAALATGYPAPVIGGLCVQRAPLQVCGLPGPLFGRKGVFSVAIVVPVG